MKCPECGRELTADGDGYYFCYNQGCPNVHEYTEEEVAEAEEDEE